MLEIRDLSVRFGKTSIVSGLNCSVEAGQWLMIVGPNGAGKTTALGAITQAFPYSGEILLEGRNIRDYKATERAQHMAVLSQNHYVSYSFTVEE